MALETGLSILYRLQGRIETSSCTLSGKRRKKRSLLHLPNFRYSPDRYRKKNKTRAPERIDTSSDLFVYLFSLRWSDCRSLTNSFSSSGDHENKKEG